MIPSSIWINSLVRLTESKVLPHLYLQVYYKAPWLGAQYQAYGRSVEFYGSSRLSTFSESSHVHIFIWKFP